MASVNSLPAANSATGNAVNTSSQNSGSRPSLRSSANSKADGGRRQAGSPLDGGQRYVVLSICIARLLRVQPNPSGLWFLLLFFTAYHLARAPLSVSLPILVFFRLAHFLLDERLSLQCSILFILSI